MLDSLPPYPHTPVATGLDQRRHASLGAASSLIACCVAACIPEGNPFSDIHNARRTVVVVANGFLYEVRRDARAQLVEVVRAP